MTFSQTLRDHRLAVLVLALLLIAAYAPVYPRMIGDWMYDPNFSHGFLVPFISLWFVRQSWPELKDTVVSPTNWGFVPLILGILLLAAGLTVNELASSRSSSIVILAGIILTLCGPRVMKLLALPVAFLLFMIPWPATLYNSLALPLKHLVSVLATTGLKICGFPVVREGNIIMLPNLSLEVVEACSGMRSLVSLMALGTAYAFIFLPGAWRKVVLIAATVPIAVLTNVFRVFVTGVLARHFGAAAAEGFFHEFAGFAVFAIALLLTALAGWILRAIPGARGGNHAS